MKGHSWGPPSSATMPAEVGGDQGAAGLPGRLPSLPPLQQPRQGAHDSPHSIPSSRAHSSCPSASLPPPPAPPSLPPRPGASLPPRPLSCPDSGGLYWVCPKPQQPAVSVETQPQHSSPTPHQATSTPQPRAPRCDPPPPPASPTVRAQRLPSELPLPSLKLAGSAAQSPAPRVLGSLFSGAGAPLEVSTVKPASLPLSQNLTQPRVQRALRGGTGGLDGERARPPPHIPHPPPTSAVLCQGRLAVPRPQAPRWDNHAGDSLVPPG